VPALQARSVNVILYPLAQCGLMLIYANHKLIHIDTELPALNVPAIGSTRQRHFSFFFSLFRKD